MKMQKIPHDKTGLGFMKLGDTSSLKQTTKTVTGSHGSDGTKNLVPFVEQFGSVGTVTDRDDHTSKRLEFVKVTKKTSETSTETKTKTSYQTRSRTCQE